MAPPRLGGRLRALRHKHGLTQATLADQLGVSASYLNLIENNRRAMPAAMLLKLAQLFRVDLAEFAASDDDALGADLVEVFGDPVLAEEGLSEPDLRELARTAPGFARGAVTLYRSYRAAREAVSDLSAKLGETTDSGAPGALDGRELPTEAISDFIQRHLNHFPTLEQAAEELWKQSSLSEDVYQGLVRHLERAHGVRVRIVRVGDEREAMRRFDPHAGTLNVSEVLPPRSRRFQVAHQLALLGYGDRIDAIVEREPFRTPETRALARVALANYLAAAVLMPYTPFLEAAEAERYDIELLAHRFGASFEQVCHRLTTLRRPGREGVPFHLIRIDVAGNISKRFSASGIRIARFSGACPRWNVHAAFMTPGMLRVQISRMPDGKVYFCIARTLRSDRGGYNVPHTVQAIGMGCELRFARRLVYADGVDVDHPEAATPVGVTCRLCEHLDCAQRAFPSLLHPLRVDENVRGVSFYAPVGPSERPVASAPRGAPTGKRPRRKVDG